MVVVKIELWPGGDESKARAVGLAVISNDGKGSAARGNYEVALSHSGKYFGRPEAWKYGRVERHSRRLSPYHLVMKAIQACLT